MGVAAAASALWSAIWPNLAASVLWVPISVAGTTLAHHVLLRRHLRGLHARLDRHGVPR